MKCIALHFADMLQAMPQAVRVLSSDPSYVPIWLSALKLKRSFWFMSLSLAYVWLSPSSTLVPLAPTGIEITSQTIPFIPHHEADVHWWIPQDHAPKGWRDQTTIPKGTRAWRQPRNESLLALLQERRFSE